MSDAEAEFWEAHYNLCPDTAEHDLSACAVHGCPNFLAELEALAPWGTSRAGLKGWAS